MKNFSPGGLYLYDAANNTQEITVVRSGATHPYFATYICNTVLVTSRIPVVRNTMMHLICVYQYMSHIDFVIIQI